MAGEWIKFETATLNKPEVMRMGRTLGVTKDHVVGLLVRFWVWLDLNSVDGVVDGVETRDVDDVVSQNGFAVALASVGWLEIDALTPGIRVPKFGRHNGESAKKRALKNERQARWRANSVDDSPSTAASTREEKRREEITTAKAVVQKPRKAVLQEPTTEHQSIADEQGVSCQAEFQKYRDWLASNGKAHRDEAAGFRNWLRNAKPLRVVAGREPTLAEKRAANMAALTGQIKREREVFAERVGATPLPALPGDLREPGDDDVGGRTEGRAYRDVG